MKEKKLKGYKLNGVASVEQVGGLLDCFSHENEAGLFFWGGDIPDGKLVQEAKRLGILDLWFTPVYEEEKPKEIEIMIDNTEIVKVTKENLIFNFSSSRIPIRVIKEIYDSNLSNIVNGWLIGDDFIHFTIKDAERVIEAHKSLM